MARQYSTQAVGATPIVTVAETVAVTTSPVSSSLGSEVVLVEGQANVTAGASTTALTLRIRRGVGTGGAVVGNSDPLQVAAGNTVSLPFTVRDTPGEVANQAYSVTVQQTAATGNGSIVDCNVNVTIGSP